MNRSPQRLKLGIVIEGFLQHKSAEALSAATLCAYKDHLTVFADHIGERAMQDIPTADLRAYLVWMRSDYKPRRLGAVLRRLPRNHLATSGSACRPSSAGRVRNSTSRTR